MEKVFDVAIVGAGPAGATLARLLSDRYRVALIDPAERTKPCGGLLSEAAQARLAALQLALPHSLLVSPQCFAVDVFDLESGARGRYARTYTNLDRGRFDDWLRSLVPASVLRIKGRFLEAAEEDTAWRLVVQHPDGETTIHTRFLVAADGGGSRVRRRLFPDRPIRTYTAIQAHYDLPAAPALYTCLFDPRATEVCGWSLVKDDRFILGGAFARENSRDAFQAFTASVFSGLNLDPAEPVALEACPVARPGQIAEVFTGSGRVALIGEAAGFISPSSFEGISFALESGRLLASALNQGLEGALPRYTRETRPLRRKILLRLAKCPFMYRPGLRQLVLKSRFSQLRR